MAQPHRSAHVQRTMRVLWPFRPPGTAPATQQAHSNSGHGHRDRGKSQAYGDGFFIRSKGSAHSLTKSPSVLKKVVTRGPIPPDAGHRQPVKLQCQVGPHQALCGQKLEVAIPRFMSKGSKGHVACFSYGAKRETWEKLLPICLQNHLLLFSLWGYPQ